MFLCESFIDETAQRPTEKNQKKKEQKETDRKKREISA
jgi:hypothetical protein